MNQKLTPSHLRKVSETYFDNKRSITSAYGICFQLDKIFGEQNYKKYCWYLQMADLMQELDYNFHFKTEDSDKQLGNIDHWESRAWMCLFLAEYLETK